MTSLARRGLRVSAAAAGIAALGVGLAGHSLAAPGLPAAPDTGALPAAPQLPAAPAAPELPAMDGVTVPGFANVEMPNVNTAAPGLPAGDAFEVPSAPGSGTPEVPGLPEAPAFDDAVEYEVGGFEYPTVSPLGEGQNSVGAMQGLDMAEVVTGMARTAAEGGSFTEGQQIG